jgi:CRP-like cAMP-binding protein
MKRFKQHLESLIKVSDKTWDDLQAISELKQLHKNDFLIFEGEKFEKEVFIINGIIRSLKTDINGNEFTTAFFHKNNFMSISSLRNKKGGSISAYQSLTKTSIIIFDAIEFRKLVNKDSELMQLAKNVKENEIKRMEIRDNCIMQISGIDKYISFKREYPFIEEQIPHYYIASYLAISPVTLSRIRKKLKNN